MSDFILLKWRAQQALNTSLSVGGVGACMHGCMSGATLVACPLAASRLDKPLV